MARQAGSLSYEMSESSAHVESIDALKAFRIALLKFAAAANLALGDAESEAMRTLLWLETEQPTYWMGQMRKRNEIVSRCREAVRQKKIFKDATGRTLSAVDEEKALSIALRRFNEAEEKLKTTRMSARKLQKELISFKGDIQRFASAVQIDIPTATANLDNMVTALEAYTALAAPAPEVKVPDVVLSRDWDAAQSPDAMPEPAPQPAEDDKKDVGSAEHPPET